ncbi:MAG: Xaa-Pro peptidase family protein [Lachnospiraceae bacterium]|nr:Xaa-Pro peptidase family protein [Lachnospiraceae bacterium]
MEKTFHQGNRRTLYESLADGTIALVFSGHAPRKTSDEKYPFYANRNFLYLTGLEGENYILMAVKDRGEVRERLFILPPDALAERWTGVRMKPDEVRAQSGVEEIKFLSEFEHCLHREMSSGHIDTAALDLYKCEAEDEDTEAFRMAERMRRTYPFVKILDLTPQLRRQRSIKQPCEIEAIREAVKITRAGIVAMMRASKPGMYEYQYKAEFDYALAQHGVLTPAFPSIISAGENNFCIHYYAYTGQAKDGDMILNDVGAKYDNLFNDVSRGWPCNGKFSEKQRLLYTCAYNTSQHMFSIIRPGMPMADVDRLAREYNFTQLKAIGLCNRYEDVGKYIWHGGAHHVGYDVHDLVEAETVQPGMVFCVDIGIYCEEWGIGFRLEDNCLVTEDGCENLTASIPRSIEEIEAVMASR